MIFMVYFLFFFFFVVLFQHFLNKNIYNNVNSEPGSLLERDAKWRTVQSQTSQAPENSVIAIWT
jgi:hypothetical protein